MLELGSRPVRPQPNDSPYDWDRITKETCLGKFARFLYDNKFEFEVPVLKDMIHFIRDKYLHLKNGQSIEKKEPWQFIGHDKDGPFMIWDGCHRQTAHFIFHFIDPANTEFEPHTNAMCGILSSREGDFGRIPNYFCD